MADPARNIDSDDTGGDALNFDVTQTGPQLKSTKITGGDGEGSGSTTIGPSIAANDNDVANDNTSSSRTAGAGTSNPQATSSRPAQPTTAVANPAPANADANQASTPRETEAPVAQTESREPTKEGEVNSNGEKTAQAKTKDQQDDDKAAQKDGKQEAAVTSEREGDKEVEAQAKKQESDKQAAARDSNPEKAAQNLVNQNADTQKGKDSVQREGQPQANTLPVQPSLGRRNPLRSNTRNQSSQRSGNAQSASSGGRPAISTTGGERVPTSTTGGSVGSTAPGFGERIAQQGATKVRKMGEQQLADEKSGKEPTSDLSQGPSFKTAKGSPLEKANVEKQVAEAAARKASAFAGKLGANKKQQEFISVNLIALINIIFLVIELLLIETVIAAFVLVFHIIVFLWWLLSKGRWKKAILGTVALFLMPFIGIFSIFGIAAMGILGTAFVVCNQTAQAIPFGIPISYVTSIGSFFGANVGPFAQVCDHLTVHSSGVGGVRNQSAQNRTAQSPSGTTQAIGAINGQVVLVDENGQTLTPVLPNTQLVRPQPLAPEIANQANQAGYLSPASCKLGEIPYSEEMITRSVRLDNGQTKLVAFPIHKTIDCIKNDPTKTTLRSVQLGKVVRLVDDDSVLGKYVTIEYPNGLRVSYYHLDQLTPTLALGSILNAGQPIGTMGKTGQISFEGTQMLFELKDANGNWKVFNPINTNGDASILTTFPCADNGNAQCLLE